MADRGDRVAAPLGQAEQVEHLVDAGHEAVGRVAGVDGVFVVTSSPESSSKATTSVNVPPVSIPIRMLRARACVIRLTAASNAGSDLQQPQVRAVRADDLDADREPVLRVTRRAPRSPGSRSTVMKYAERIQSR